ncbi:RHS repeat-associated core domain-containing protein [Allokutzneria albata]|uniref:RHS repeat-associated core domain-containing protein n=1 Tax=Allokutzneria albata TaxID=211114 RepID=UPI0005C1A59A|nr:RHS repeat-associated core domain-containing protein [Allokutzneria albata]
MGKRDQPRPADAVADRAPDLPAPPKTGEQRVTVTPSVQAAPRDQVGFDAATSVEQTEQRTDRTATFRNADGTSTLRIYSDQAHVRAPDGRWAPVDLALARDQGGRLRPAMGPTEVSFAARSRDAALMRVALPKGASLAYSLVGAADVPAVTSGATATYRQVLPGIDLRLSATRAGGKEDLILTRPDVGSSFEFLLRAQGVKPRVDEASGAVQLIADDGTLRGTIPAGYMVDSAADAESGQPRRSDAVRYAVAPAGADTWRLTVSVDQAWLRDPARVYPVMVDPSVERLDADLEDTYVQNGDGTDRSRAVQLNVGSSNGGRTIARAYLKFDSALARLRNRYVVGASLVVDNIGSQTCQPRPVTVFEVAQPWSGASLRWPGAAVGRALSTQSFAHGGPSGGCVAPAWEKFPLDPDTVTRWTHGVPFHGLSLRAANESDSSAFKRFASANSANKPYLEVSYSPEGAAYEVSDLTLPTANREGTVRARVTNLGSSTWPARGGFRLGYIVKRGNDIVATSHGVGPEGDVAPMGVGTFTVPLQGLAPGDYQVQLSMFDPNGADFHLAHGVPYAVFAMTVRNVPPTTNRQQPGSGAVVDSLTPTLYAEATDPDAWPNTGFKYLFRICTNQALTEGCAESGWGGQSWSVPRGVLRWSQTYYWSVKTHDNVEPTPTWPVLLAVTTRVPQPQITAHLASNSDSVAGPGLDPQIGNYTTQSVDASVPTVGPDLTITRTYNSLDPRRATAFGIGWASRLDMRLADDLDGTGNVVITYPSGRQMRLGRNPDGPGEARSYAPPAGVNITLVYDKASGISTLRDASGSRWDFDVLGRLISITDAAGLTERLEYDAGDRPVRIVNEVSKRLLSLTWQANHVSSVKVFVPELAAAQAEWTYTYDGDRLTKACTPSGACTVYGYGSGSHYRPGVLEDNPRGYWRFAETSSDTTASAVARTPGADAGVLHGVVLGADGAVGGPRDRSMGFDGASSFVTLPSKLVTDTMTLTAELWFKTAGHGSLLSYADQEFPKPAGQSTPILYVGVDGLLHGGFAMREVTGPRQATSTQTVNDDAWHHVVLSAAVDHQVLYLDGVEVGRVSGLIDHGRRDHMTVGAGSGKDWPATNGADFHFTGQIDEVALYRNALGLQAAKAHHSLARPIDQLTSITLPQDKRLYAQISYDDVQDRVRTLTDHQGRAWTLDAPTTTESTVEGKTVARRTVVLHGPFPDYTYVYDPDNGGRMVERTHGGTLRYEYNQAGFRSAVIDQNGHRSEQTTDDRGNVLSRTTCRAAGHCNTSYFTYIKPSANPLDPRTDKLDSVSDARSTNPQDTRFRTTYTYDPAGRLTTTTSPTPQGSDTAAVEIRRYTNGTETAQDGGLVPAGLLASTTSPGGQTTTYTYRRNGDLAQTISPDHLHTQYGYDERGRPKTITLANAGGVAFGTTTYTYTPNSQIESVTEPPVTNSITGVVHTKTTTYRYDANGNTVEAAITDATPRERGGDPPRVTTFDYDAHDRLRLTRLPNGGEEKRDYELHGLRVAITDVRGTVWSTLSDEDGRVQARTVAGVGVDPQDPKATGLALEFRSYDPAGRLATVSDAMGRTTTYTYYDDNLPATTTRTGFTNPNGTKRDVSLEHRDYDPAGNLTEHIRTGGLTTRHTYDAAGYLASSTDDPDTLKRTVTYQRDAAGKPRRVERTGAAQPGRVESTTYDYHPSGRLKSRHDKVTDSSVVTSQFDWDERGLLTAATNRRLLTTRYTYDAHGQLVGTHRPPTDVWVAGQKHTGFTAVDVVGRNASGEVTHVKDPAGGVTVTERDAMGGVTATVLPAYTPPGGAPITAARITATYDLAGNITEVTDALGRTTTHTYDPYGRTSTTTLPPVGETPAVVAYRYDRAGELLSHTQANGVETRWTYDDLGRRITHTQLDRVPGPLAYYTTTLRYDDAGNPTATTSPMGYTSTATYNAFGEQTSQVDATGRAVTTDYDIAGRQHRVITPDGLTATTTFDLLGRATGLTHTVGGQDKRRWIHDYDDNDNLTATVSPEGRRSEYFYDDLDRQIAQIERPDNTTTITTSQGYDRLGHRSRFTDGEGHSTDYTVTPWGLPESVIEPETPTAKDLALRTWTTSYDPAGQPVRLTAPGGVVREREFNAHGRLTVERGSGAEAATTERRFAYDAAGRTLRVSGPRGDSVYRYDDRDHIVESLGAAGHATYDYNGDGHLTVRTDASGRATFDYDPAGRVASMTDPVTGRTMDYAYDPAGRLGAAVDRALQYRITRSYGYDELGRLASDKLEQNSTSGAPTRTAFGEEYDYDLDDKLTEKKTITGADVAVNSYGYDRLGRLTSWTNPAGATTSYAWDKAGNRTTVGTTRFTYDERNRLTTGASTTYDYTARGTLARATTNGQSTAYTFDAFDRMATTGTTRYSYDALDRVTTRNTTALTYAGLSNEVVSDGTRLVSRLPDGTPFSDKATTATTAGKMLFADRRGDVIGRYIAATTDGRRTFDPFGTVTTTTGETSTLGYQGDWTDPDTSVVNMTARWYTPSSATFTSRDDWTLTPRPSAAANRYSYGNNDPINNIDPTGHLVQCATPATLPLCTAGAGAAVGGPVGGLAGALLGAAAVGVAGLFGFGSSGGGGGGGLPIAPRPVPVPRDTGIGTPPFGGGGTPPPGIGGGNGCVGRGCTPPPCRTKPCRPVVVAPRPPLPPPPPPWLINALVKLAYVELGSTIVPRPAEERLDIPAERIIDTSSDRLREETRLTRDLPAPDTRLPDLRPGDDDVNENQCFAGLIDDQAVNDLPETITHNGVAAQRATGGTACIATIHQKRRPSLPDPVGFDPSVHVRGHLIAHMFHGSGQLDNLVPLFKKVNNPEMLSIERQVKDAVVGNNSTPGQRVFYRVNAYYWGANDAVPDQIRITAVGSGGFKCHILINNEDPGVGSSGQRSKC